MNVDWRRYYDEPDSVLKEFEAEVVINDSITSDGVIFEPDPSGETWYLMWKHGCIQLGTVKHLSKHWAKVQAALYCHLWTKGVGAAEADDISCGYAACHQWFKGVQKVYQLRAIGWCEYTWMSRVVLSDRLWFSREAAEKCKEDFAETAKRKGPMVNIESIHVDVLELRQ